MPRRPRNKSKTGIYHIVMRGINRQSIFEDEEDCSKFIEVLQRYKKICEYKLYAYCLMGNHVHLLLMEGKESLDKIMRRICSSYVLWYNHKYDRVGHLFQNRYRSEIIEDYVYFLTALRYIYQNPVKANIVTNVEEYEWTNYMDYIKENDKIVSDFVFSIFDMDKEKAIRCFIEYISKPSCDICIEMSKKQRVSDEDAKTIIKNLCNIRNAIELQKIDKHRRNEHLRNLKEVYNLSIRQIGRVTGINRGVIQKA